MDACYRETMFFFFAGEPEKADQRNIYTEIRARSDLAVQSNGILTSSNLNF